MRSFCASLAVLTLTGCGQIAMVADDAREASRDVAAAREPEPVADPVADAPPPPATAQTVEDFDTTSAEDREAAAAAPPDAAAEQALGETVASLGDPARPGFWIETALVSEPGRGRVLNPATGKSAQVDLIPIEGPDGTGSRLSLAAMRLIEAPLTDLPTVEVFSGGAAAG